MPNSNKGDKPFGPNEEKAIISLAFTSPEFFGSIGQHLDVRYFHVPEVQYVFAILKSLYEKHDVVPTREMVRDAASRSLTVDDEFKPVFDVIDRKSDPREIPVVKDVLLDWAKNRAFGMLYSDESIDAYERGDYNAIIEVVENAQRIVDVSQTGDEFFKTYEDIFSDKVEVKLTTGFRDLDKIINEGGPTKGDVFIWMAPTGVGKTIALVNTGAMCFRANLKVLHITLEISIYKTKLRYAGVFSRIPINARFQEKEKIITAIEHERSSHSGSIMFYEFPPDEISVDTVYQLIKWLRRNKGWAPDVVIIDYLELMMSRCSQYNKDDYVRQKRVATEIRGLAKKENVLVFSATQTNRALGGKDKDKSGESIIDVNRIAESYGKSMPTDYIVSINQTPDEYHHGQVRFYVAKNRNGPKFATIAARVNYDTMVMEVDKYTVI